MLNEQSYFKESCIVYCTFKSSVTPVSSLSH